MMSKLLKLKCNTPNGVILQLRDGEVIEVTGYLNSDEVIDGFGITDNVDADFWATWVKENKGITLYTSGSISALEEV